MLQRMSHRGPAGRAISETSGATIGVAWTASQFSAKQTLQNEQAALDNGGPGRLAFAAVQNGSFQLGRDLVGIAPLYYGRDAAGTLYWASEVKALLPFTRDAQYLPPGHTFDGVTMRRYLPDPRGSQLTSPPQSIARELQLRLSQAVRQCIRGDEMSSWLSGGLDSSAIAAVARQGVRRLRTFAVGLPDAPDLEWAQVVAQRIRSEHHEIQVGFDDMLAVLPDVIYHLESFDALLVRSSVLNYLAGRAAAEVSDATLSGEGGDELFAGYAYLKDLDPGQLDDELVDITGRLHNTALQRVDRCAAAHGIVAHVPFLAPDVVNYAFRIPTAYKLRDGVEKWILREAVRDYLPEEVLTRTKAKFWEGAGVGDLLAQHAEERVSDRDFAAERALPNGWRLNTKEELMYYRIFRMRFGELDNLDWMGRTKGAPADLTAAAVSAGAREQSEGA